MSGCSTQQPSWRDENSQHWRMETASVGHALGSPWRPPSSDTARHPYIILPSIATAHAVMEAPARGEHQDRRVRRCGDVLTRGSRCPDGDPTAS
jgi:hypothetical protein